VASYIRGSGVISDRARVIWTMARSKAGKITFGIPISHGTPQHNGLPGEFHETPISLVRDPANTMLHFRADYAVDNGLAAGTRLGQA